MKRIVIILTLLLIAAPAFAGPELATKDFQENSYPKIQKQIQTVTGADIPLEVDWKSIAVKEHAHMYFTKIYFTPLVNGLKHICANEANKKNRPDQSKKGCY